jgi:hypothetical protein
MYIFKVQEVPNGILHHAWTLWLALEHFCFCHWLFTIISKWHKVQKWIKVKCKTYWFLRARLRSWWITYRCPHQFDFDISSRCSLLHAHLWPSKILALDHIIVLLSLNPFHLKFIYIYIYIYIYNYFKVLCKQSFKVSFGKLNWDKSFDSWFKFAST